MALFLNCIHSTSDTDQARTGKAFGNNWLISRTKMLSGLSRSVLGTWIAGQPQGFRQRCDSGRRLRQADCSHQAPEMSLPVRKVIERALPSRLITFRATPRVPIQPARATTRADATATPNCAYSRHFANVVTVGIRPKAFCTNQQPSRWYRRSLHATHPSRSAAHRV